MLIIDWLEQVGIAFDMMLNAVLGGVAGQTISLRAALASRRHVWFACVFCRFLSWLVQRDHCLDQLTGVRMTGANYLRATAGLLVLAAVLLSPIYFLLGLL